MSVVAMPAVLSAGAAEGAAREPAGLVWDRSLQVRIVLEDMLEHPFYWWPRSLLGYRIEFRQGVSLDRLRLNWVDTGDGIPIQFSEVVEEHGVVRSGVLHFFSDLPSGGRREFLLTGTGTSTSGTTLVTEVVEGATIVLDTGDMKVRLPGTQDVRGSAPGPILQVSRGGAWAGSSTLTMTGETVTRITSTRVASGPLFIRYELVYEMSRGSRYVARIEARAGMEFVQLVEDMEGLRPGVRGLMEMRWDGFGVTHRQAPNHPFPLPTSAKKYEAYAWEPVGQRWPPQPGELVDGEIPFTLGIYEPWAAYRIGTFANFWDERSGDALGVFIDKAGEWQDHEYAVEVSGPTLQVRYRYRDGKLAWEWPLARGRRSVCVAFYDHAKDIEAMHRSEQAWAGVKQDGVVYKVAPAFSSHTLFLQNRYGSIDLNVVKDWVLGYAKGARQAKVIFAEGAVATASDLEVRVMTSSYACTLPSSGTRQNGGFGPVPARQVSGWWIDGFNRLAETMTERQRRRLTAMYLLMAYVHAGEDYMPLIPMVSGHPNFLADVRSVPPAMSFLFPDHPMAHAWADMWEKCVQLNTHYNTRPAVRAWDAWGGRWTENIGTYVWAFLRPALRADFLLRQYNGVETFATAELAEMCSWLVGSLSAPFDGETEEAMRDLDAGVGHQWGLVEPGKGPRRVYPPQGAHAERHLPPASLWYLGTCLERFAPLVAEYAMWAAPPANEDFETSPGGVNAWRVMDPAKDRRGTNPRLESRKYTGYGIVLRAAVDTRDEVSIHLQQIDEGPNYRWGRAAEGGCGVLYFFAAGKAYGFNGQEDVGDRDDPDTEFCTNFGVFKEGTFRSIGQNVLSRPFYNLGVGQYAEVVPRTDATAYAAPEYVGRSVMLAGYDYFVLYDQVLHGLVAHRLSWFVRRGSELPEIKLVRGGSSNRQLQRTEVQTAATTGVWFDGSGDSMALVSHRKDLEVKATSFGCRVNGADVDDLVFRNPEAVRFGEGEALFAGTAGMIRRRETGVEFCMFHGTAIGCGGLELRTVDAELGIGGSVDVSGIVRGRYYAPVACSMAIGGALMSAKMAFCIDGEVQAARAAKGSMVVALSAGQHEWELTEGLPFPVAPRIIRTENRAGGARVIVGAVAGAVSYRLELSRDDGLSWTAGEVQVGTELAVRGLGRGEKVHVRAVALNEKRESAPGREYPLYVSDEAPAPPDGLRVELAEGAATVSWGEVLGVAEYRLYARPADGREFHLIYKGLDRVYVDRRPGIRASGAAPDWTRTTAQGVVEYCVSSVNGNGEGVRSRLADTDAGSWRNWEPRPGERFRRVHSYPADAPELPGELARYYPR
jgi:hypothetical protein